MVQNCPHCGKPINGQNRIRQDRNITRFEQKVLGLDGLTLFEYEGPEYFPNPGEALQALMVGGGAAVGVYVFVSQALIATGFTEAATRAGLLFAAVAFVGAFAYQQLTNNASRIGYRHVEREPERKPPDGAGKALLMRKVNPNQTQMIYLDITTRKLRQFAQALESNDYDLTYRPYVPNVLTQPQMKKLREAMHELGLANKTGTNRFTFKAEKAAVIGRWKVGNFTYDEREFFQKGPK